MDNFLTFIFYFYKLKFVSANRTLAPLHLATQNGTLLCARGVEGSEFVPKSAPKNAKKTPRDLWLLRHHYLWEVILLVSLTEKVVSRELVYP